MGKKKPDDDQYPDEETNRRFEAALRGAREVGHESMKDIHAKRRNPHPDRPKPNKNKSEKPVK